MHSKDSTDRLLTDACSLRLYDERLPPEPTYPSVRPSEADFRHGKERTPNGRPVEQCHFSGEDYIKHAPPGSSLICVVRKE